MTLPTLGNEKRANFDQKMWNVKNRSFGAKTAQSALGGEKTVILTRKCLRSINRFILTQNYTPGTWKSENGVFEKTWVWVINVFILTRNDTPDTWKWKKSSFWPKNVRCQKPFFWSKNDTIGCWRWENSHFDQKTS